MSSNISKYFLLEGSIRRLRKRLAGYANQHEKWLNQKCTCIEEEIKVLENTEKTVNHFSDLIGKIRLNLYLYFIKYNKFNIEANLNEF